LYFAAGRTNSNFLPVTSGVFGPLLAGFDDGFLAALDGSATIVACSYLGGVEPDEIFALARSSSGELFAAGSTRSPDFPTTPGAFDRTLNVGSSSVGSDAFIVRTKADFSSLSYASYLGGGDDECAIALAALDADSVLIAGETTSYFFPTTAGAHRTSRGILATLEGFATQLDLLPHPIAYGVGKLNSYGASPVLDYYGFPSVQEQNFNWVVHSAIPHQPAVVFIGAQSWSQAFQGGLLYVRPPLSRVAVMSLDFVGYAEAPFALSPAMIGTTIYAQAWSKDPGDALGVGLSSALEVLVHP
jgi:hypothetical protein